MPLAGRAYSIEGALTLLPRHGAVKGRAHRSGLPYHFKNLSARKGNPATVAASGTF